MARRHRSHQQGERTTASTPLRVQPDQKIPRGTGCILVAMSGVALGFGLLLLHMTLINPLYQAKRASTWKQVPCIVKETRVVAHRGGGKKPGTSYQPFAEFDYSHDGKDYSSSRFWLSHRLLNNHAEAKAFLEPFPSGQPAQCWMNPLSPSEAVLNRDFVGVSVLGALFGSVLAMIGLCGLLGSIWLIATRTEKRG